MEIIKKVKSTNDLTPKKLGETVYSLISIIEYLEKCNLLFTNRYDLRTDSEKIDLFDFFNVLLHAKKFFKRERFPHMILNSNIYMFCETNYKNEGSRIVLRQMNFISFILCLYYIWLVDFGEEDKFTCELKNFMKPLVDENFYELHIDIKENISHIEQEALKEKNKKIQKGILVDEVYKKDNEFKCALSIEVLEKIFAKYNIAQDKPMEERAKLYSIITGYKDGTIGKTASINKKQGLPSRFENKIRHTNNILKTLGIDVELGIK